MANSRKEKEKKSPEKKRPHYRSPLFFLRGKNKVGNLDTAPQKINFRIVIQTYLPNELPNKPVSTIPAQEWIDKLKSEGHWPDLRRLDNGNMSCTIEQAVSETTTDQYSITLTALGTKTILKTAHLLGRGAQLEDKYHTMLLILMADPEQTELPKLEFSGLFHLYDKVIVLSKKQQENMKSAAISGVQFQTSTITTEKKELFESELRTNMPETSNSEASTVNVPIYFLDIALDTSSNSNKKPLSVMDIFAFLAKDCVDSAKIKMERDQQEKKELQRQVDKEIEALQQQADKEKRELQRQADEKKVKLQLLVDEQKLKLQRAVYKEEDDWKDKLDQVRSKRAQSGRKEEAKNIELIVRNIQTERREKEEREKREQEGRRSLSNSPPSMRR